MSDLLKTLAALVAVVVMVRRRWHLGVVMAPVLAAAVVPVYIFC